MRPHWIQQYRVPFDGTRHFYLLGLLLCLCFSIAQADVPKTEHFVDSAGDLDRIKLRGVLKIIVPANLAGGRYLPRQGSPVENQQEIAEAFARSQGLQSVLVPIRHFSEMMPALMQGKGDILVANLTVTEKRKKNISFSVPLTQVREQVLVRAEEKKISKARHLSGKKIMADENSAFWQSLKKLQKKYRKIQLVSRPQGLYDEDELDFLAEGAVDAVVRDSNIAQMYLGYRDDIKVAFDLKKTQDIAWGVRKDAPQLRAALNEFLLLGYANQAPDTERTGDLDDIQQRKTLRLLIPNNAASYYLHRGTLMGFEYEFAKAFAKHIKAHLEIIVPETHDAWADMLLKGQGDIATGFLEPQAHIIERGIAFTRPYHSAPQQIVVHDDSEISQASDLKGRTISVRQSSPYWKTLEALRTQGVLFSLEAAPEHLEVEELIDQVAKRELDITVADGHLLGIELAKNMPVKAAFDLGEAREHAVAVRANNPELLAALNAFIKKHYKGSIYNVLYRKYFKNKHQIRASAKEREAIKKSGKLSPYDSWIQKYAEKYNFDWRLITAQMFQESRFNPTAKSSAGALGLMQVMPRTAKFMGFNNLLDPITNIHAGVKYMDWVREQISSGLSLDERIWFTLASYNAGHGHVADAQRLAKRKGWDSTRWFDHTERAILLLSKRKYASKARYGYVRGRETAEYVRNILHLFKAYVEVLEISFPHPK